MKYSLDISSFLNEISTVFATLLFSSISLHCSLKKAFSSLLAVLRNLVYLSQEFSGIGCIFPFLVCLALLFSAICKVFSWEYQTTLPASWETCLQARKQQLEPDVEQLTGSKLGKEYDKTVYSHPTYLTYMQSISGEMPGWMKHKLESRLPGEIATTSDIQMTPL